MASPRKTASPTNDSFSTQLGDTQTLLSAFEGVISNEDAEKQTERLIRLFKTGKKDDPNKKDGLRSICVLHDDRRWQHQANNVYCWYQDKKLTCDYISYFKPGWLEEVKSRNFTHFLFFGLPPCDRGKKGFGLRKAKSPIDNTQMEADFFTPTPQGTGNLHVNNVVVVLPEKIYTKKENRQKIAGHYLEHYLKLDGQKAHSVLAASALGVFAAPQPKPMESDNAYWSVYPKLVEDFRPSSRVSLGLTIMTRDMAEGAPFTRIVLINSISTEFRYEFYSRVARYTHIQSINGILLDGLDIEKVTDVFKKLPDHHIQMMLRYVHNDREQIKTASSHDTGLSPRSDHPPPLRELPTRHSSLSVVSHPDPRPTSLSNTHTSGDSLLLPLPLFILGDNYRLCKQLYKLLSEEGPTTPEGNTHSLHKTAHSNGNIPTTKRPGNAFQRSISVPHNSSYSITDEKKDLLSSISSEDINNEESDSVSPLHYRDKDHTQPVRLRSSSFKGISSSDKCMSRAEVPLSKFEKLPDLQHWSEFEIPSVTSPLSPGSLPRQDSSEAVPQHRFILHLPNPDLDRLMTHLYFKSSGVYLVVIGLEDLIANPLCQYENLFYWVNLIHTYVSPEVKRMFVVGMYNRSTVMQLDVLESVRILNNILCGYRQAMRIPFVEQGYVLLFDLENSAAECEYLCSCIANCTKLFYKSSFYYARDFHNSVFRPFPQFQKLASDIALNNDRALLESKYAMGERFQSFFDHHQHVHLPHGYYETLAAYSTACISRHCDGCLLMPSVIPDLLNHCAQLSNYAIQVFDDPLLRNLPLISINLLRHSFNQLHPNNIKDFQLVIWWMEHLSIIYSVGKLNGDEKFFIPFLLHYQLSDWPLYNWDEDKVETMFEDSTVLYAQFSTHVPMTIHLFHKILAHIMQSILKEGAQPVCFLNPDSPEVVLPLHDDNNDEFLCDVWVKYRAIQNMIEFQAKVTNRLKFLHVVESKLSKAFLGSKYYNKTIDVNRVVSFRIPADHLSKETTQNNIWDLAQLQCSQDDPQDHLVATRHLTEPGNRRKTAVLRSWAAKDPEVKEIPSDLNLEISRKLNIHDNWVMLGARLNLLSSDDIQLLRSGTTGDPGARVLQKWRDSQKTFKDLINGLRELHLDNVADKVEEMASSDDSTGQPVYRSRIMEKKLPTEFFVELSKALNMGDRWAALGGYLNLLKTLEIESLRQNQRVDKGEHVLQLWTDSHLTFQDLINGLRSNQVRLDSYVQRIEEIIKSHLSSARL